MGSHDDAREWRIINSWERAVIESKVIEEVHM